MAADYGIIDTRTDFNSIIQFYQTAQENEFARKFQFKIGQLGPLTEKDLIYFHTANVPQRTIANQTVPFMGLDFNLPGAAKYDGSNNWAVQFRCDEAANIRAKLLAWQDEIFSVQQSGGRYGVPVSKGIVYQLGKDIATITRKFVLQGIYPVSVGELQYDIGDAGAIQEFTAGFAYQFWYEEKV